MIPTKSAARYEKAYAKFQDWRLLKLGSLTVALSDNIVSAYLYAGSMKGSKKASTLFCESAKLKKMLFYRDAATAQYFGAGCNVVNLRLPRTSSHPQKLPESELCTTYHSPYPSIFVHT